MNEFDLHQGNCLDLMPHVPSSSVDLILCDLPYGTTACRWDTIIPFDLLWAEYKRIAKPGAAIVLTACQPFTTALISSNMKMFKYCWVWEKSHSANFMAAKFRPLAKHEDIVVFASGRTTYNPQMTTGKPVKKRIGLVESARKSDSIYGSQPANLKAVLSDQYFPSSVLKFSAGAMAQRLHPTQKPVDLMEYLVRTYTNEGELVLDNCMGSGTT